MHRKTVKRGVFSPMTQKIKAPEHVSRLQDEENESEQSQRIPLPDLHRKGSCRGRDTPNSWDEISTSTSVTWSEDLETCGTQKVLQQWDNIEKILYNEADQMLSGFTSEECAQWKVQVPHLRIVGKNLLPTNLNTFTELNDKGEKFFNAEKDNNDPLKGRKYKKLKEEVFNLIFDYVTSELFTSKDSDSDTLSNTLNQMLRITPAPINRERGSARSSKSSRSEQKMFHHDYIETEYADDISEMVKDEIRKTNQHFSQRRKGASISAGKLKNLHKMSSNVSSKELDIQQQNRNKRGTVFNERIVVSPVPFSVSTRESFSTLKSVPIKFMGQTLNISNLHRGSGRNSAFGFKAPLWKSNDMRLSSTQSAWQAPVCPTVWPKNIRLAPIDTSRLPSSKNRSSAPLPTVLHRNIKPLTPIPHSTMTSSIQSICEKDNEKLEIQGKHIVGLSAKSSLCPPSRECSPKTSINKRKKSLVKNDK